MADKSKDVVVNITPFNLELIRVDVTGFTLEFMASFKDDYSRRKRYRLRLEWWWMSYITDTMKKAYQDQKDKFMRYGKDAGFED